MSKLKDYLKGKWEDSNKDLDTLINEIDCVINFNEFSTLEGKWAEDKAKELVKEWSEDKVKEWEGEVNND